MDGVHFVDFKELEKEHSLGNAKIKSTEGREVEVQPLIIFLQKKVVLENDRVSEQEPGLKELPPLQPPPVLPSERFAAFISYAHVDEEEKGWKTKVQSFLSNLERESVSTWHDGKILPGEVWEKKIIDNLHAARIVFLLVTQNFIASKYCYEKELPIMLERHAKGEAVVIPIILDHCDWENSAFSHIQGLPPIVQPLTDWPNPNKGLQESVKEIRRLIDELRKTVR